MSRIQQIQPSYQQNSNKRKAYNKSNPSFGSAPSATNIKPIVEEALLKSLGKTGTVLNKLSQTAGEVQNLLIIAVGTAFICPLFIMFNPISKQDDKTKKYTAARQPISAVISTAFAWGINNRVDKWLNKSMSEGKIDKFNMSAKPSAEFLNTTYHNIKKNFGNLKGSDKTYFDKINEDQSIKTLDDFNAKFRHPADFETAVQDKTLTEAAKTLLNPDNKAGLHHQTLRDFLINNKTLKFEADPVNPKFLNPDVTKNKAKTTLAMQFLREFGFSDKEMNEQKLRTFLGKTFYNYKIKFNDDERKFILRAGELLIPQDIKDKETIPLKLLMKVLNVDEGFYKNNKLLDMPVDKFILGLRKEMGLADNKFSLWPFKSFRPQDNEELIKHAKTIINNNMNKVASDFKAYTKMQGIILSLITLPFSCSLLNWAYPRIMEKCCPSLSAAKQNAEVKGGK